MKKSNRRGQLTGLLSPLIEKIRLAKVVAEVRGKQILDVGCGTARLKTLLPENIDYLGLEKNKAYVGVAKNLYPQIKIFLADVEKDGLNNFNQKFDSIILAAVLEHLKNPLGALAKIEHLLKPAGIIIITTPTRLGFNLHHYLAKIKFTSPQGAKEHIRPLAKADFRQLEKTSNLKLLKYEKFTFGLNQLIVLQKVF